MRCPENKRRPNNAGVGKSGRDICRSREPSNFFNANKGFGFITPDSGGPDIFLHITAVERAGLSSLNEGQRVSFETEPDKKGKGPKAVDLHLV